MSKFKLLAAAAAVTATLGAASVAEASTWIASSGTGSDAVSGQAVITTAANQLTVALTSLESDPISSGQQISGVQIELDTGPLTASLFSQAGQLITVQADGGGGTNTAGSPTHWGAGLSGGLIVLETIGTFGGGGQPFDLIIDGDGNYGSTNHGFKFNPYIRGTGTFVVDLTGADTPSVKSVTLLFGTNAEHTLSSSCTANCFTPPPGIPEPTSWALMLLGFGGMGAVLRQRRAMRPTTA